MGDVAKLIKKEFGDIVGSAYEEDLSEETFSISPAFDVAIGEINAGSIIMNAGVPKLGKTTLALFMAERFITKFPEGSVWFIDVEQRLRQRNLSFLSEKTKERFSWVRSTPTTSSKSANILTGESYLKIIKDIYLNNPYSFVVLDSLSALCPESEMVEAPSGDIRGKSGKLISNFLKQICNVIRLNRGVLFSIHQCHANLSGYGSPIIVDGGTKIKYFSDTFIMQDKPTSKIHFWPDDETRKGQICNWVVPFSVNGIPGAKVKTYLEYGKGFNIAKETLDIAIMLGVVIKSGAWFKYGELKVQGFDNMADKLEQDTELLKEITQSIKNLYEN